MSLYKFFALSSLAEDFGVFFPPHTGSDISQVGIELTMELRKTLNFCLSSFTSQLLGLPLSFLSAAQTDNPCPGFQRGNWRAYGKEGMPGS